MSEIIVSGIQPSGPLHVGNYLGAIQHWRKFLEAGERCYFFIADYHALTETIEPKELSSTIITLAAELVALGIDPRQYKNLTLFVQSHVPEHTELSWVFHCITPIAELERMTQYKDKAARQKKNVNVGLFSYPVLQAADVLMYKGTQVPVGEDQVQHVELMRRTARRFAKRFGTDLFPEPKPLLSKAARVKSLLEPTKKMSKSLGEGHVLNLADGGAVLEAKLKKAVTATAGGRAPGVENLFVLLDAFGSSHEAARFQSARKKGTIQYSELKPAVAGAIASYFEGFRNEREKLLINPGIIAELLASGARQAQKVAEKTMDEVRDVIGLR